MPWQSLELPSLPLGLLRAALADAGHPAPMTYHGCLRWAEFLMEATNGEIGVAEYTDVAENGLLDGLGDWVFAGVLNHNPDFGVAELRDYAHRRGINVDVVTRMREYATEFVMLAAAEIIERQPAIVGFTSTFMQNAPSLAVAEEIKRQAPEVSIILGGGNCDDTMGIALHRNFPFVDLVVRGEGERTFPALLNVLAGDGDLSVIPGLCWRGPDRGQRCNAQTGFVSPDAVPMPDFDDWFERLAESPVAEYVEPKLVMETSRGCWWGEKHQCTFCGLNGSLMSFRAKPADIAVNEITTLVQRHQVLDIIMADNIVDNTYFKEVFPRLALLESDLRLHYEVKANLKPADVIALRDAGVMHVQPGIESLVTRVLQIMDKGTTAIQNVRTLRDCESAGLSVSWSWLYGFPGEQADDYQPVLGQVPSLVHLQPPTDAVRILLERFSPYFENPASGFAERVTASAYRHVYALPEAELRDMVYFFDCQPAGIDEAAAEPLHKVVREWKDSYHASSLRYMATSDSLVIEDRRAGWPTSAHEITDPMLRAAYLDLASGRSVPALMRNLSGNGFTPGEPELRAWLSDMASKGFLFEDDDRWLALATPSFPIKMS
jgi:ribosomal peptide maturation radical SAM protein 1